VGGLLVGLYLRFVLRSPAGHGVSEVIVAVETRGSRLPWITGVHTAIGSTVTIGSGGSAGPEGPIIQIGAALSSGLGQLFRLPAPRLRTLLACGAGAGLAGMYHAPLTGAAFASEVLLEDLEPRRFSLLALAAVASTAVAQQFSVEHVITAPALPNAPWQDVPLDVLLGLIAAPLGVALFLAVYFLNHRMEHSRIPFWLGPALGGLAVGLIGLFFPLVLGSGDTGIQQALNGQLATGLLVALPFAKLAATSLTLGSGATGGVFTPSLFIGATLGGAFGAVIGRLWSGASPESAYALVGMGTVVAAVVNAPLTAVLLVCEFTRNFTLLPQVVAAVAASVMLARRLHAESIYTLPLRSRGIDRELIRSSPLARIRVREVMTSDWPTIAPDRTLRQAMAQARTTGRTLFPVVDTERRFQGVLSLDQVTAALERAGAAGELQFEDRPVRELALRDVPLLDPDETLHDVALTLGGSASFMPVVPVVRRQGEQYLGVLERAAILRSYSASARWQSRSERSRRAREQANQ
jgi:CIC family chloride channel protein